MIKIKKKMSVKAQLKNTSFSIIVIPAGNILKTLWSKITAIQFKLNSKLEFKFLAILKSVLVTKSNFSNFRVSIPDYLQFWNELNQRLIRIHSKQHLPLSLLLCNTCDISGFVDQICKQTVYGCHYTLYHSLHWNAVEIQTFNFLLRFTVIYMYWQFFFKSVMSHHRYTYLVLAAGEFFKNGPSPASFSFIFCLFK